MANELRYTLDISKENYAVQKCKQLDDRTVMLTLLDKGQPYKVGSTSKIQLKAKKPDNTFVIQTNLIEIANDNIIFIPLNRDITRIAGEVLMELQITQSNLNITTFTFKLQVQESVIQDGDLQSKNSITATEQLNNAITNAITTINNAINNVNAVKKQLDASIANGNTTQMRNDIDTLTKNITNPNLVPNGGFENGNKFNYWSFSEYRNKGLVTLGWNYSATTTANNNYMMGNYTPYMRATSVVNGEVGGLIGSTYIVVKPNTIYTLSYYRQLFRGKVSHEHSFFNGSTNIGYILQDPKTIVTDEANRMAKGSVWDDSTGGEIMVNGTMWKRVAITFTTPATCTQIRLACVLQYSYSDAFLFVDNFKLEEGSVATPYCEAFQPIIDNTLTTDNKYVAGALNEHDAEIGNMSTVTTTAKNAAAAIIELNANKQNKPEFYTNSDKLTWYRKFDDGLLIVGGGTASFPNVGGNIIDLTITLPITIPSGFELKFYGNVFPIDQNSWTSTSPSIYQLNSTQIRVMIYGGLTNGKGYSISWLGIGRWK